MIGCCCFFLQPDAPNEQQKPPAANTADQAKNADAPKSKQDRVIRYRIEKEKSSESNLNLDMKEIFQELSLNLQEQMRSKSNLMDELSLLSKDADDDIKDEAGDEQEATIALTPDMERANGMYDQAMKLINATTNRQYEA